MTTNLNSISHHFDKKAENYQNFFERWPFNLIRKSETNAVFSLLKNLKDKIILEPGCGSGFYTRLLLKKNVKQIYALDLAKEMLNNLPKDKTITSIHADASTMNLDLKFDYILSAGMLEFTPSPINILRNLNKHANLNCQMVLLLPRYNIFGILYKFFHKKHKINLKLFREKKVFELAKNSNWKLDQIKKCGLFSYAVSLKKMFST